MTTRREFMQQMGVAGVATAALGTSATTAKGETTSQSKLKMYAIPHTDIQVSRIAYGCAGLSRSSQGATPAERASKASRIIHAAHDNGITLFDHADIYGSEEVFGQTLKASPGLRQKIVIQSKCGQRFASGGPGAGPILPDVSREHIVSAVEGSLRSLGTDHLDILLLHVADTWVEPDEVARAFDELGKAGKVRHFGVSNYNASQIQLLKKSVRQPIVVNQIPLGLAHTHAMAEGMEFTLQLAKRDFKERRFSALAGPGTLDYCRLNDIQIQAYAPLRGVMNVATDASPELRKTAQLLEELAHRKETTVSAVALAWVLSHPAHIVPLIGSSDPEHISENCAADRVTLTHDEWYSLFAAATQL
jgi:predicted oxidoreductase